MEPMHLSPLNAAYVNKVNTSAQTQNEQVASEPVKNGDKKIKTALIALGALGAAAIGMTIAVKTGKINLNKAQSGASEALKGAVDEVKEKATNVFDDIQPGVKKFLNASDDVVENVKLEKGKAIMADGSAFSGTMLTKNNKGQEIILDYQDGFIQKSTVDKKLKKEYFQTGRHNEKGVFEKISRNQGNKINSYDSKGKFINQAETFFDEDGKVKRFVKTLSVDDGGLTTAHDFKNGKISAKSQFNGSDFIGAEIYNGEGKIIKELKQDPKGNGRDFFYEQKLSNGETAKIYKNGNVDRMREIPAEELLEKSSTKEAVFYDKNGKMYKSLSGSDAKIVCEYADIKNVASDVEVIIPSYIPTKEEFGVRVSNTARFSVGDDMAYLCSDGLGGRNIPDKKTLEHMQQSIGKVLSEFKEYKFDLDYNKIEECLAKLTM